MIRLADLARLLAVLPVGTTLSRALGYSRQALPQRIRRGSPELTEAEAQTLAALLARAGLVVQVGDAETGAA